VAEKEEITLEEDEPADPSREIKGMLQRMNPFGFFKKSKSLILAGGTALVGVLLLLAVWFFFFTTEGQDTVEKTDSVRMAGKEAQNRSGEKMGPRFEDVVELAPFGNIKLQTSRNLSKVDMHIALELAAPAMREMVMGQTRQIREIVAQETGKQTWLVLRSPQGKLEFKYILIEQINSVLSGAEITNLYFTQLIMK